MALRVPAIRRRDRQIVVVIDVAQIAGHVGVPIGEQESRGAVVERCCRPADRRVARRAIRKCKCRTGRWMDGICGLSPGRQMALRIPAIRRSDRQIIVIIYMTESARHIRMAIRQQESGRTMVELGVQPIVKRRMTGFASRRELCGHVVGIGGFLKIPHVARLACGRKPQEITDGGVLMALIAFYGSMRAEQRKSVEVLLNRLHCHLPAENCVAPRAVGSELTAVKVRVTVGAVLPHIGEGGFEMALRAGDFFV